MHDLCIIPMPASLPLINSYGSITYQCDEKNVWLQFIFSLLCSKSRRMMNNDMHPFFIDLFKDK